METAFHLLLGLIFLVIGGESLVQGASRAAFLLKVSPLVVGLTVVAFGTSSPELATSLIAVRENRLDIAVGNVVGSNILNVFLILGVSALIVPLTVHRQIIRFDVPVMVAASLLLLLFGLDGSLGRFDGILLFGGIILYTLFQVRESRREPSDTSDLPSPSSDIARESKAKNWGIAIALLLCGLGLLILGSRWLVSSSVTIAKSLGLSEAVIGLTLVAIGTSLPEIVTSLVAALRGQRDMAVGNIVGSNIYNILAILGLSGILAKDGIPLSSSSLGFDIPVMIGAALACLPIFFTGHRIDRWEGALFLFYYLAYTSFLVLKSVQHDSLPLLSAWMLGYVMPLSAVTLAVYFLRAMAGHSRKSHASS